MLFLCLNWVHKQVNTSHGGQNKNTKSVRILQWRLKGKSFFNKSISSYMRKSLSREHFPEIISRAEIILPKHSSRILFSRRVSSLMVPSLRIHYRLSFVKFILWVEQLLCFSPKALSHSTFPAALLQMCPRHSFF